MNLQYKLLINNIFELIPLHVFVKFVNLNLKDFLIQGNLIFFYEAVYQEEYYKLINGQTKTYFGSPLKKNATRNH